MPKRFHILVVTQNQADCIPDMLKSLRGNLPGVPITYALDRCTDDSATILADEGVHFVENKEGTRHQTGRARNLGLEAVPDGRHVLFLDGDRVPVGLQLSHLEEGASTFDISLLRIDGDFRNIFMKDTFTPNLRVGFDKTSISINNHLYTCGALVTSRFINEVKSIQNGLFFHPYFYGRYGSEDCYLGDLSEVLGYSVGYFPVGIYLRGSFFTSMYDRCNDINLPIRKFLAKLLKSKYSDTVDRDELIVSLRNNPHINGTGQVPGHVIHDLVSWVKRGLHVDDPYPVINIPNHLDPESKNKGRHLARINKRINR